MEFPAILLWLEKCIKNGVITEKDTEMPMSTIGSLEFIEAAVKKISFREGFGNVLAEGLMRAADSVGSPAKEIAEDNYTQTGRGIAYGPKVFSPSALVYATEPRASTPQLHEICEPAVKWAFWYTTQGAYSYVSTDVYRKIAKRLWGSEKAADFSTYDGKALAAVKVQNRQYAKECLILCDFVFPIFDDASSEDHVGDPSLESRIFSAATGIDTDEEELNRTGERVFNLYRAILLLEGRKGRQDDYLPESQFTEREEPVFDVFGMFNPDLFLPGAGDEIVSRKGKALDRDKFKQMLDEYYEIRGWDKSTGLIKKETLQKLGLPDIIKYKQISL
jgi:aldehyde:ferredoxin oxidoreductase